MAFIALRPCRIDGVDYDEGQVVPDHDNSRQTVAFGIVSPVPEAAVADMRAGTAAAVDAFDPGDHTAPEVATYLDEHPDQIDRVARLEDAGKARKGVLADIEDRRAATADEAANTPDEGTDTDTEV